MSYRAHASAPPAPSLTLWVVTERGADPPALCSGSPLAACLTDGGVYRGARLSVLPTLCFPCCVHTPFLYIYVSIAILRNRLIWTIFLDSMYRCLFFSF